MTDRVLHILCDDLLVSAEISSFFRRASLELQQMSRSGSEIYHELIERITATGGGIDSPIASRLRSATTRIASDKRRKTSDPVEHQEQQLAAALSLLASLERDPTAWRRLQHEHLRRFPKALCTQCAQPICLQCGAPDWHGALTCSEHLRHLALTASSEDVRSSMQWQLENRYARGDATRPPVARF